MLMILTGLSGVWLWWRGRLLETRWYLWPAQHAWWLGFVAVISGWIVTETGRQPGSTRKSYGHAGNAADHSRIHDFRLRDFWRKAE
jgi:cytochrome bd-type quinol oxidase subunit 1